MAQKTLWLRHMAWSIQKIFCLALLLAPQIIIAQELLVKEHVFPEWFEDTRLNDVFFIDRNFGFAVGERGLILMTEDGGENWIRKLTQVNCAFHSIHFADAKHGWIVGGYHLPSYRGTKGLILRTKDGGNSWHQLTIHSLPYVQWCHFISPTDGWAVGYTSPSHRSGVMMTRDGGSTWSSFQGSSHEGFKTAALTQAENKNVQIQVVDWSSNMFRFANSRLEPGSSQHSRPHNIHAISMMDETRGFAVGDLGRIVVTQDAGRTWTPFQSTGQLIQPQRVPTNDRAKPLPMAGEEHAACANAGPTPAHDLRAVCVQGDAVWFAGSPGSFLYRLDLSQSTWTRHATNTLCGINRIHFVNPQRGWAVGDQGTILSTLDGGQTWKLQRGGRASLSILHVARSSAELSWEFVGKYALEDHILCGVCVIDSAVDENSLRQAAARLGISNVSIYRSTAASAARDNPSQQLDDDVRQFIRKQIHTHRPQIVIVEGSDAHASADLLSAVLDTDGPVQLDNAAYGDLGSSRPPFVLSVVRGTNLESKISTRQPLLRVGRRLDDHLAISSILTDQPINADAERGLNGVHSVVQIHSVSDLRQMVRASGMEPVVRPKTSASIGTPVLLRASSSKEQIMSQFYSINQDVDGLTQLQGTIRLLAGLDEWTSGVWMHELSEFYIRTGKFELAAEIIGWFARSSPSHPLLYAKLIWLWTYYSSHEMAMWQLNQTIDGSLESNIPSTGFTTDDSESNQTYAKVIENEDGIKKIEWKPVEDAALNSVAPAFLDHQAAYQRRKQLILERQKMAQRVAVLLERLDFNAFDYPHLKFSNIRLNERLGVSLSANSQLIHLAESSDLPVAKAARQELLIGQAVTEHERLKAEAWLASLCDEAPHLDGILDDDCWQNGNTIQLTGERTMTQLGFRYDDEFLYLAIRGNKVRGWNYDVNQDGAPVARPRDADLSEKDRVVLQFDIDRDLLTWFELHIDSRGWIAESCCNQKAWNPTWYVAQHETDEAWTIEAAIPLSELTLYPPQAGSTIWRTTARRYLGAKLDSQHLNSNEEQFNRTQEILQLLLFD